MVKYKDNPDYVFLGTGKGFKGAGRYYRVGSKNFYKVVNYQRRSKASKKGWESRRRGMFKDPVIWVDFYWESGKTITSPKCATPIQLHGQFADMDEIREKAIERFHDDFSSMGEFQVGENQDFKPSFDARYHYNNSLKRLN